MSFAITALPNRTDELFLCLLRSCCGCGCILIIDQAPLLHVASAAGLTWRRGGSVRLHQLLLGQLLFMLLAGVVLLRHQGVVEGRLADGAEAVGVVVVAAGRPCPSRCHARPRPAGLGGGGGGGALLGLGGCGGGLGRCGQRNRG